MSGFVLEDLIAQSLSQAVGFAVGFALSSALAPDAIGLAQGAWQSNPNRAPDAGTMADGVAQGQVDFATAAGWAAQHGYGQAAFEALVNVANGGPALGYAYQGWRRGELDDDAFKTALKRTGLEDQWVDSMVALKDEPLDPAEIAKGIHRGIMAGDGLLVSSPSSTPGNVPFPPQSSIDPVTEAAWSGIDAERLRVLVGNAGLPPSLTEALQLLNRGTITEDDFSRVVAESNLRNEYADVLLELRRRIITPHEYAELELRGWIDETARDAGAALSGMTPEDTQLLFELGGRPLPLHQITTGLARGGTYQPIAGELTDPYQAAVRQSSTRPEFYDLAIANKYTIPSYFVLDKLAASGAITQAELEQYFLESGWPPDLAAGAAAEAAAGTGSTGKAITAAQLAAPYAAGLKDRATLLGELETFGYPPAAAEQYVLSVDAGPVTTARTAVLTKVHTMFVKGELTEAQAVGVLAATTFTPATQAGVLANWKLEAAAVALTGTTDTTPNV